MNNLHFNQHHYHWRGTHPSQRKASGTVLAPSINLARLQLQQHHINLISLVRAHPFNNAHKITDENMTQLLYDLGLLLQSGVPILQALHILLDNKNPGYHAVVNNIQHALEEGLTLTEACAQQRHCFNAVSLQFMAVGEQTGRLDKALLCLSQYQKKQQQLKKECRRAMVYPAFVLGVSLFIFIFMLLFVIPTFAHLFAQVGAPLPRITQWALLFSTQASTWIWPMISGILFCRARLKKMLLLFALKIPVFKNIKRHYHLLRFTLTLHDCLTAGIHLDAALHCTTLQDDDPLYRTTINQLITQINAGHTLAGAMQETGFFPSQLIAQIHIGEESGNLETMLGHIALGQEEKLTKLTTHLSQMLEPAIMVSLGCIMGFFIVSLYLPLFTIGDLF